MELSKTPLEDLLFRGFFADHHSDCCHVNVSVDCICMSLVIPDVELCPWPFLLNENKEKKKECELNVPLEIVFWKDCPLLNFFIDIRTQDFFEGRCHLQRCNSCG